jgi:hypothetical protein
MTRSFPFPVLVSIELAFAIVLAIPPAVAQDQNAPQSPSDVSSVCVNAGNRYEVGEFACIAACHQQRRLARCDVVANRTSWTYVSEACPSAMINPPWPSDWSEVPAVAAMTPIPLVVNHSAPAPDFPVTMAGFRIGAGGW